MKQTTMIRFALTATMMISTVTFGAETGLPGPGQGGGPAETLTPVRVQVAWSQAAAKPFNAEAINLMVIVTDYKTGVSVPNLISSYFKFKFMEPGCLATYGAEISQFANIGNGVYQIQLKPHPIGGCAYWQQSENHAVEVMVYEPASPVNAVGRYGITTMRIDIE